MYGDRGHPGTLRCSAMPTTWEQMFDTGRDASVATEAEEEERRGLFSRMRESLSKSRRAMTQQLTAVMFDPADADVWERLEEALIYADWGVAATVAELMRPTGDPRIDVRNRPAVILMTGVNGSGKTTSIGKIAYHLREAGMSCVIGAADTFRAAAGEQLEAWAERAGADFVSSQSGADPAAVAFDSVAAAQSRERDVVIVDTAGRLHTQDHLMEELRKIHRVIGQREPGAPHEVLLTIDATTGQNGLQQARLFSQAVEVTGIVLTKLDGTAKGGIALAIAHELGIPVKLIGVGEGLEDLRPFDPETFARALFSSD